MKKIVKNIIGYIYWLIYKRMLSYEPILNTNFHIKKFSNKLKLNQFFSLSKNASVNIGEESKGLFGNSLTVDNYSVISVTGKEALLKVGKDVRIGKYCNFNLWNSMVTLGDNVLFNNYCSLNAMIGIEVGDNTWFGEGVRFYDHNHQFKESGKPFTEQGFTTGKIIIGSNVWVGCNTVILQNVVIGDGCVIGANNLIYKSLPPNTIVKAKAMEIIEPIKRN